MEDVTLCCPQEQEVFQRVWQRVMGGRPGEDSPLEVAVAMEQAGRQVDGDLSCAYLASLPAPQTPDLPPALGDRTGSDLLSPGLESPGGEEPARLRQQTLEALEGWQFYRHLSRRARGNSARALTALAADQHRQARRLAAVYFLRSGLRYWPCEQLATPSISSFWGALRQRHQGESQAELDYRMAADDTGDEALRQLYLQLMEGCREHCLRLRELLEESCQ